MKKTIWLFILAWIEREYQGKADRKSSRIVDCCVFLKEEL
jgi:hypothetical protein